MWTYAAASASLPPDAAPLLIDCALIAGEDGDWAMCHVGEEYRHLSLCSAKGFAAQEETVFLWRT